MALKELLEIEELQDVYETSVEKPVLLFKQSTTCPVSAGAFQQFKTFLNHNEGDYDAYFVKVRESRPVSDKIAEDLGIRHQSPQIFLIKDQEAMWNESHAKITVESIKEALQNAQ